MSTSEDLVVEGGGKITLPDAVREHYGLAEDTPLRVIETRGGILLVPLTPGPMGEDLLAELEEWQALGGESLGLFPYEDSEP
ncbi:MAG TPA: AbrB/MazE/SpoVT family DNA-binding domain-containing protein [Pyrinomonadaceae bacterium]|jgi:bifunctional DNA-binding transcriptional regulator/antitoxin component of YhaV-PrlF toxin-antitoxin module